jgi:hypothetical protein
MTGKVLTGNDQTLPMMPALLGAAQLALLAANLPLATTIAPLLALTLPTDTRRPSPPSSSDSSSSSSAESELTTTLVLPIHAMRPPPAQALAKATSLHVFAFAGSGAEGVEEGEDELLLAESEGDFSMTEWEEAWGEARRGWVDGVDEEDNEDGKAMSVDSGEGGVRLDAGTKKSAAREWLVGVLEGQG